MKSVNWIQAMKRNQEAFIKTSANIAKALANTSAARQTFTLPLRMLALSELVKVQAALLLAYASKLMNFSTSTRLTPIHHQESLFTSI